MSTVTRYVTRWALTTGIKKLSGELHTFQGVTYFKSANGAFIRDGVDAFATEQAAQDAAHSMRERRIDSLERQLVKLQTKRDRPFKVVE